MVTYPKDWKVRPLIEAVDIYQGGTPKTTVSAYWNGSIIWVTPGEITKLKSLYIDNSERKITELGLIKSSACLLPEGAILLCSRATIGDLAIAKKPMATNQGFKNLVCKMDVHNVYLAYLLTTKKAELIEKAIGTTFLEISKKELSKIQVVLPSLPEQKDIAKTLSCLDTHIANLTELIEKKKAIRDGALEDLVSGKTRLKGFSGQWKTSKLKDLCYLITKQTGFDYTESIKESLVKTKTGDVIPFIQNKDFEGRSVNYNTDYYIPNNVANSFPKILLNEKCVLISISGKLGNVGLYDGSKLAFVGGAICVVKLIDKNLADWIVCYLQSPAGQRELLKSEKASSHRNLTVEDIRNIDIPLPEENEQESIVGILNSIDDEIVSLEEEKDKMLQIKAGAMDDLLTGRIRLTRQGG